MVAIRSFLFLKIVEDYDSTGYDSDREVFSICDEPRKKIDFGGRIVTMVDKTVFVSVVRR